MNHPPWLHKPEVSQKGMLLALARRIHESFYRWETLVTKRQIRIFNTMSSGDLEKIARILFQAGFTKPLDNIGARYIFTCTPDCFADVASSETAHEIDMLILEEAIDRFAVGGHDAGEEILSLAQLLKER